MCGLIRRAGRIIINPLDGYRSCACMSACQSVHLCVLLAQYVTCRHLSQITARRPRSGCCCWWQQVPPAAALCMEGSNCSLCVCVCVLVFSASNPIIPGRCVRIIPISSHFALSSDVTRSQWPSIYSESFHLSALIHVIFSSTVLFTV